MKIAKIFTGNPSNQKGAFNNILERCKRIVEIESNVDLYMIRYYHSFFLRLLKRKIRKPELDSETVVQGLKFNNLWVEMRLWDYLMTVKFKKRLPLGRTQLIGFVDRFARYDILSVHGYAAVCIADESKSRFRIPFVSTWHGSEINYVPFFNNVMRERVAHFLERADHNFFVSEDLMNRTQQIAPSINKSVLYTGPSDFFLKTPDKVRLSDRLKSIPSHMKVVGFIGDLLPVKNVMLLPEIFRETRSKYENVCFVIVGDGASRAALCQSFNKFCVLDVFMTGNVLPSEIPGIMRRLDVLVLPSLNEGLPRVTLEAQVLGTAVVGSDRGGIPEAIGEENSFALGPDFIQTISDRIVSILETGERPSGLPDKFSWENALKHERKIHQSVCRTIA